MMFWGCRGNSKEVERPEKIISKREVIYDKETYAKLSGLWHEYYREFPSEEAYANWMYATRYAQDQNADYQKLLAEGIKKYPGNPTLLYLYGIRRGAPGNDREAIAHLEKATRLDPHYADPWYSLAVDYLESDPQKADFALRHLLETGAVAEVTMDYNYNLLSCLGKNAILITNGDMDTYPCWILGRVVGYRPDVLIINKSLLNTEWYPFALMRDGLSKFITQESLKRLSESIMKEFALSKKPIPPGGIIGDTLIAEIVEAAKREHRPVYFAATLELSPVVDRYKKEARNLGLTALVTPSERSEAEVISNLVSTWLERFRTGGLDSWKFRFSREGDASRFFVMNYAAAVCQLMEPIKEYAPAQRLELFHWYRKHLLELIPQEHLAKINQCWTNSSDIKEIGDWLKSQGYIK
jgi:tetratricopeptide (TPR) repeat protein